MDGTYKCLYLRDPQVHFTMLFFNTATQNDQCLNFENQKIWHDQIPTNLLAKPILVTGTSTGASGGSLEAFFGKGFILILRSSMTVSPFSSHNSAGSFDMATSSSCLSRGK